MSRVVRINDPRDTITSQPCCDSVIEAKDDPEGGIFAQISIALMFPFQEKESEEDLATQLCFNIRLQGQDYLERNNQLFLKFAFFLFLENISPLES